MNPSVRTTRTINARVQFVSLVAGLFWLVLSADKLLDVDSLRAVLQAHGILPVRSIAFVAWAVPSFELVGALIFLGWTTTKERATGLLFVGLLLVIGFTVYLARVPEATLATVGCGCGAAMRSASTLGSGGVLVRNACIALAHLAALAFLWLPRSPSLARSAVPNCPPDTSHV